MLGPLCACDVFLMILFTGSDVWHHVIGFIDSLLCVFCFAGVFLFFFYLLVTRCFPYY